MIRAFILLYLSAIAAGADPVEDWIAQQEETYRWVLSSTRADERLMGFHTQCPADVFPKAGRRAKGSKTCDDGLGWCLTLCRSGHGNACFGIARTIETEMSDEGEATLKFPMFMAACADGNANGCTNAGASAKNGSWIDGTAPQNAASRACQFRTYDAACGAGSSWGCYMLGLEWGVEGVQGRLVPEKAQAAWRRSCELLPDSGACDASKRQLDLQ